jgi:hypothetical protein
MFAIFPEGRGVKEDQIAVPWHRWVVKAVEAIPDQITDHTRTNQPIRRVHGARHVQRAHQHRRRAHHRHEARLKRNRSGAHDTQAYERSTEPFGASEVASSTTASRYPEAFGVAVAPLTSSTDAVGTWPETATAVAVRLLPDDSVRVVAPCGLDDLFGLVCRRNPRRVTVEEYRRRVQSKRIAERWPMVTIVDDAP